jgi:hypothetical protein
MSRSKWLAVLVVGALAAAPAMADKVLTLATHTDAVSMMGHTKPAKDEVHEYWFGNQGVRYDLGDTSVILRIDTKKFININHVAKTFSVLDMPIDMKKLVDPQMAPMMDQMMKMMAMTVTVTPSDRTGTYAGFACKFSKLTISSRMMTIATDECLTDAVPIDYARYKELVESQSELAPNSQWMKDLVEKVHGFPVYSETSTTMMGKTFGSSMELKSVEDRAAAAGQYEPPAGYTEVKYDPMRPQPEK